MNRLIPDGWFELRPGMTLRDGDMEIYTPANQMPLESKYIAISRFHIGKKIGGHTDGAMGIFIRKA